MRYSAHGAMKSRCTALISNCNRVAGPCLSRLLLLHYGLRTDESPSGKNRSQGAGGERLTTGTLSPVVPTNDRKRKEDRKIEAIYSHLKNDGI
jgi:hypothetical protein